MTARLVRVLMLTSNSGSIRSTKLVVVYVVRSYAVRTNVHRCYPGTLTNFDARKK